MATKQKNEYAKIQKQLAELEKKLLRELQQRLTNVRNTSSEHPTELLDLASDGELDYMSAVSAEAGSDTVREIQGALQKLRDGTYGVCEDCGKPISKRRLKARPFATLCIGCKERFEQATMARQRSSYARGAVPEPEFGEDEDAGAHGKFNEIMRELEDVELKEMF